MVKVTKYHSGYDLSIETVALTRRISLVSLMDGKSEILRIPSGSGKLSVFVPMGGMTSSYGMNSEAVEILDRSGKVLVMDFVHPMAFPYDSWLDFYPADGHSPVFARHNNRMNVLFTDGAVKLIEPDAVDPISPTVESTYWLP